MLDGGSLGLEYGCDMGKISMECTDQEVRPGRSGGGKLSTPCKSATECNNDEGRPRGGILLIGRRSGEICETGISNEVRGRPRPATGLGRGNNEDEADVLGIKSQAPESPGTTEKSQE